MEEQVPCPDEKFPFQQQGLIFTDFSGPIASIWKCWGKEAGRRAVFPVQMVWGT